MAFPGEDPLPIMELGSTLGVFPEPLRLLSALGKDFVTSPSLAVRAVFMEFKDKPSQNLVPPPREPRVQAPHRIFHLQAGM